MLRGNRRRRWEGYYGSLWMRCGGGEGDAVEIDAFVSSKLPKSCDLCGYGFAGAMDVSIVCRALSVAATASQGSSMFRLPPEKSRSFWPGLSKSIAELCITREASNQSSIF